MIHSQEEEDHVRECAVKGVLVKGVLVKYGLEFHLLGFG